MVMVDPQPEVHFIEGQHHHTRPRGMATPTSDEPAGPHARPSSSEVTVSVTPSPETRPRPKSNRPTARPWYHPIRLVDYLVEQWFIVGIGVFIVLAWRFPQVAKDDGLIKSQYTIHYGAIAAIFLITGLTLSTQALINQSKNLYLHLFTNTFVFLFFPAVMFAIVNIVKASGSTAVDPYVLAGMMIMAVMPTTVASNITMTRNALGNTESATIEVCIGNVLGVFITPLLLTMFLNGSWAFGAPIAAGGDRGGAAGLVVIYKQIGQRLGLALFLPLIVGQVVQNIWKKQTRWVADKFRLAKVSSFLLLTLIWAAFSNQFAEDAFSHISTASVIFIVFVNLGLYVAFTLLCLFLTRLPWVEGKRRKKKINPSMPVWQRFVRAARFGKRESTAICFCAAAKGIVVGSPVLSILYGGFTPEHRAIVSVPLVLYQGEQVVVAQILVSLFRRWNMEGEIAEDEDEDEEDGQQGPSAVELESGYHRGVGEKEVLETEITDSLGGGCQGIKS